jgi:hypothetical protein
MHTDRPDSVTMSVPYLEPKDRPASRQVGRGTAIKRRLLVAWSYTYALGPATYRIRVPAGVTYRPSVPGLASVVIPERTLWVASLPHDVLYQVQGDITRLGGLCIERWAGSIPRSPTAPLPPAWRTVERVDRQHADQLFRHVVRAVGTARWRAALAYVGVRSPFGAWAWAERDAPPILEHSPLQTTTDLSYGYRDRQYE